MVTKYPLISQSQVRSSNFTPWLEILSFAPYTPDKIRQILVYTFIPTESVLDLLNSLAEFLGVLVK